MVKIAIVEDDAKERSRIRECLDGIQESDGIVFDIAEYESGQSFIDNYSPGFDIVFMDIEMPGIDGMETSRKLREMDSSVILIFVTNMAQFAISGYEVEALDFILKPINRYSFAIKVKRAIARIPKKNKEYILVKNGGETRTVLISSIHYVDIDGHYVVYHFGGGESLQEYATLKEAKSRLNGKEFVFVNRSCLVNLYHVTGVDRQSAYVGDVRLDISRPQKKVFMAAMMAFSEGVR